MGFIANYFEKRRAKKQHAMDVQDFKKALLDAAEDGKLTDDEIAHLEKKKADYGLSDADYDSIKVQVYEKAFAVAKADKVITEEEERDLEKLQRYLELPPSSIAKSQAELSRLKLLAEIKKGNLPVSTEANLITQKGEVCYWAEPSELLEERVVRRRYEGGSRGVSVRICKGVSYRVGAQRGQLVSDTAVVPVSTGKLILTSKRVVFTGDKKSFNSKLDKLLDVEFYSDGIKFSPATGKPKLFRFSRVGIIDIVGAIFQHAVNNYQ